MRATLTLDNDVAALLDRARKEKGQSLEEIANELLRRTLRRLGAAGASQTKAQETDGGAADVAKLETAIDEIYEELRDLVARSAEDNGLASEIEHKREQLHDLQLEEAAALRRQAEARLHLKPGEGYRILERAEQLLRQ